MGFQNDCSIYVLASDLDGTFLAGADEERERLYNLVADHRSGLKLIFVTGRGLESVLPLLEDPFIPKPDYIICDIGATVVRGEDLLPVQPLQAEIESRWPGTLKVLEAMKQFSHLELQRSPQERRCSFFVSPEDYDERITKIVDDLGCDVIYSRDWYFDVLPSGVNKGSSLLQLIESLDVKPEQVIVAGDTMNDRTLFEIPGVSGIIVGEAEQLLVEAVQHKTNVHVSNKPGADGILEGLVRLGLFDEEIQPITKQPERETAFRQLFVVYHRPPFEERRDVNGKITLLPHKSPNGIVPTLLGLFAREHQGYWVSWSKQASRDPDGFSKHVAVDAEKYPGLIANRIALTAADVRQFYEEFSKEAFWPIIFCFPDRAVFLKMKWKHYCKINRIFAERIADDAAPEAFVWIHDYNLWMVPMYLRHLRPDTYISFFHHTAFPPPDVFNIIPWSREIVSSLVQCDEVSFHIPSYAENFVNVVRSHMPITVTGRSSCAPRFKTYGCALGIPEMTTGFEAIDRKVIISANPVGIDYKAIEEVLTKDKCRAIFRQVRSDVGGKKLILSVERLDYVKGPIEKLQAFERFVEEYHEVRGKVTLFNIITPAASGMTVYDEIREEVDRITGRINGRFSKVGWTPVRYFFRPFPFEEVVGLYVAADIAWITPLRDGLNLVAKEFIAAKGIAELPGTLVLSEFSGASAELHGALLTNPYDPQNMVKVLHQAFTLDKDEQRERMRRMVDIVRENDVWRWSKACLREQK